MMSLYNDDGENFKPEEPLAEFTGEVAGDAAADIDFDGLTKALASRKTEAGRYKAIEKWAAKQRAQNWHSEDIALGAIGIAEECGLKRSRIEEACHRGYELDLKQRTEAAAK